MSIIIYADGACKKNPGPGGWGTIVKNTKEDSYNEYSGAVPYTTNNRMELTGVIEGLKSLNTKNCDVLVVTDSAYVVNSVEKGWLFSWERIGWKRKDNTDTLNKDLWIELLSLIREHNKVKFNWVKGHSGHKENERCDLLANMAITNSGYSVI